MITLCSASRHVIVALVSLLVERRSALARTCNGRNDLGVGGGVVRDTRETSWIGVVGVIDAVEACLLTSYGSEVSLVPLTRSSPPLTMPGT